MFLLSEAESIVTSGPLVTLKRSRWYYYKFFSSQNDDPFSIQTRPHAHKIEKIFWQENLQGDFEYVPAPRARRNFAAYLSDSE